MYQVKKSKTREAAKNAASPSDPVDCSLPGSGPSAEGQEFLGKEFRILDRYALQDDLVETLRHTARHRHLVKRAAMCHRSFDYWRCDQQHAWARAYKSCNCRLCPHCQRKRSLKLSHRWSRLLDDFSSLRYVVLAERNSSDLREGIKNLYAAWKRLRSSRLWKTSVEGCIVVLEVTYNAKESTWHPHLNILFQGSYIPFEALRQEWSEATRHRGQTSWIQAANTGTVRELLKYVTKLSDFVEQPDAVDAFLHATKNMRFIRTYGTLYNIPVEEDDNESCCPDCKSTKIVRIGSLRAQQVVIDFKGVLRAATNSLIPLPREDSPGAHVDWPKPPAVVPWLGDEAVACYQPVFIEQWWRA